MIRGIKLQICKKEDKKIISGLCQFYFYDLDTHSNLARLSYANGCYAEMAYFDNYWQEDNRFPYLIIIDSKPIGFVLVHDITVNLDIDWKLAELFIMAPYKKQGVGSQIVRQVLKRHAGCWEISVLKDNTPALTFWRKIFDGQSHLTHESFENYIFYETIPVKPHNAWF